MDDYPEPFSCMAMVRCDCLQCGRQEGGGVQQGGRRGVQGRAGGGVPGLDDDNSGAFAQQTEDL